MLWIDTQYTAIQQYQAYIHSIFEAKSREYAFAKQFDELILEDLQKMSLLGRKNFRFEFTPFLPTKKTLFAIIFLGIFSCEAAGLCPIIWLTDSLIVSLTDSLVDL